MEQNHEFKEGESNEIDWKNARKNLNIYALVKNLTDEELKLLNAVMYGGRDNRPPYGTPLDKLMAFHRNRDSNIHALTGKAVVSVHRYLTDGLKMYS